MTALRFSRRAGRAAKDYELSDMLRRQLEQLGVTLNDLPDGTDQATFHETLTDTISFRDDIASSELLTADMAEKIQLSGGSPDIFAGLSRKQLITLFKIIESAIQAKAKS